MKGESEKALKAYVVADIEVRDAERYEKYKALAPSVIAAHGGRYLARGGRTELLEGDWSPKRTVIVEFPSLERAKAWWDSVDYAEAKALRQASASTNMLIVEGL